MNSEIAIQKLILLPESIQIQVIDYIEFLLNKYLNANQQKMEMKQETEVLSNETKTILDDCLSDFKKNPQKVKTWQQVEQDISSKYNYDV